MKSEGGELVMGINAVSFAEQQGLCLKALEFVIDVWDSGLDMDEMEMQDKMEKLGLLIRENFDPAKHRGAGSEYMEVGDPWYMINPEIKVVLENGNPMAATSRPSGSS
jgi:hypothetical protein